MKIDWSKIIFMLFLAFIAFKVTQPSGMSRADKKEIKAIEKKLENIDFNIKSIRLDKSKHYDTILDLVGDNYKNIVDSNKTTARYEKLRSTPITNTVGDSLARAILKKAAQ